MKFESAGKTTTVEFIGNKSQFLCIEMYENGGNFILMLLLINGLIEKNNYN